MYNTGVPGGSVVKNPPANAENVGLIPDWGRPPGGGNGNPLQCSCQENPMDRGALWAKVHGVTKSWTQLNRQQREMCATYGIIYICIIHIREKTSKHTQNTV